jgi:hypothetical protein
MYESYYLRLFAPDEPIGVWIRHTIHKRPGCEPVGTVWFTFFDRDAERPVGLKQEFRGPFVPAGGWLKVGESSIGPEAIEGSCGEASWSLVPTPRATPLFHLGHDLLYRSPLPKTKPVSPMPDAVFGGEVTVGDRHIAVNGWRGMIGHNWGAEHAERWIWMAGAGFAEDPEAWIDVVLGRIKVAGRLTPWVSNGALSLGGAEPVRLGGMLARGVEVNESPRHLDLTLPGEGGREARVTIDSPPNATVGWRYADPLPRDRPPREHEVANCSITTLTLTVNEPGQPPRTLTTGHGGAYELGMTERDHGVPIEPGTEGELVDPSGLRAAG